MGSKDEAVSVPLRRLAPIELFSSTRHHMGIYRCVTVTCRYLAPLNRIIDAELLYAALRNVISAQPMLRVGILAQDTNEASFCHIKQVDLRHHVSFSTLQCETVEHYNDQMAAQQGWHHDQLWEDIETRPPWRVAVVAPTTAVQGTLPRTQDVIFAFHHSLMDGTSGRRFHQVLLKEINRQLSQETPVTDKAAVSSAVLHFPEAPELPESQEQIIAFKNSPAYIVKTVWNELGPAKLRAKKAVPWHGKSIDFTIPYTTRTKPVDVSPAVVKKVLQACRDNSTSITALLHALTLASCASRIPAKEASYFAAATPINLRPFVGPNANPSLKNHFRVLISSYRHEFPPEVVAKVRTSSNLDRTIWNVAKNVKEELNRRVATLPKNDIISLLKYNSDWFSFFKKKDGKPREDSWEISNIGVFTNDSCDTQRDESEFIVSRVYFTNGAMVAGPPVGLGVATAPDGTLTIALSWQEGVVTKEFVDGLAEDLNAFMERFDMTGGFGPGDLQNDGA